MSSKNIATTVEKIVEPLLEDLELELVEVEFTKEGNNYFLRVFIDKPSGITLDDCEALSRKLDLILDEKDPIPYAYSLEVSSPGICRPLKKKKDFERFVGEKIKVKTFSSIEGSKSFKGKLLCVVNEGIKIEQDKKEIFIPMSALAKANLNADF